MPEGMPYTAPKLIKRADKSPVYQFWCAHCNTPVNGYTISDINNAPHPMALNVYCHDTSLHIGIKDIAGFREMMAAYEVTEAQPNPPWFNCFETEVIPQFKVDDPTSI